MNKLFINTDGGSRGNPGPAAIGVAFFSTDGKEIFGYKEFIGEGTNNMAEYTAILRALEILSKSTWFVENNSLDNEVYCRLDSKLVVEQLRGNYKVKTEHIGQFVQKIKSLADNFSLKISFNYIPREENKAADKLVNEALDLELKKK